MSDGDRGRFVGVVLYSEPTAKRGWDVNGKYPGGGQADATGVPASILAVVRVQRVHPGLLGVPSDCFAKHEPAPEDFAELTYQQRRSEYLIRFPERGEACGCKPLRDGDGGNSLRS